MKLSPAARRALNRFEEAVRNDEMRGSRHPSDWLAIEEEYKRAKELLEKRLS